MRLTVDLSKLPDPVPNKILTILSSQFHKKPTIAVWFSCGAASAVAAKLTLKKYGSTHNVRIINNPILEEHEDNRRFLKEIEQWLGVPIELATHPDYPEASAQRIWEKRKFMSGPHGAPCTTILKKAARTFWEKENDHDYIVLGFTFNEIKRHERFVLMERDNSIPVLIDAKLTKRDCFKILQFEGIRLPKIYELGYPNANCIGCVKATSPTYWNHVRSTHPLIFKERADQSRELGARLVRVNNKRIFLDELDPSSQGRPMKDTAIECGIFCEERTSE